MSSELRKAARGEPLPQTELGGGGQLGLSHWHEANRLENPE